jgi:hypothetical protein
MNMPVEASPAQPAWDDTLSGNSAEAAQRDLFEFLATSDASAPPLVADTAPQADLASPSGFAWPDFQSSDFASDVAPSVSPEGRHMLDGSNLAKPEMYAARSAAQAVDEVTKENLRRLEATMSWLQNEVRHLPRAPQIPPVRGVPTVQAQRPLHAASAFDAVIDRSSLHRTVHGTPVHSASMHGSPPLPIWLREHEAPIRLPPPRVGRGLWRRLVKFFWACTVAAPIAYVFAITTLPLHKHLADMAGLTSAISSLLPTPDAPHAPLRGRELIAIAPIAAPEQSAAAVISGANRQSVAAIPSGTAVVAPVAAGAVPAQAAAAPAEEVVALPVADRARAPEAVNVPPDQPVVPTTEVAEFRPISAPAQDAPAKPVAREDASALVQQGKEFFDVGDLVAARILFRRAANAGDAAAAVAMGATYDPVVLAERGVRGVAADLDKARAWYERAKDMGSSEGPRRLEMLANR